MQHFNSLRERIWLALKKEAQVDAEIAKRLEEMEAHARQELVQAFMGSQHVIMLSPRQVGELIVLRDQVEVAELERMFSL